MSAKDYCDGTVRKALIGWVFRREFYYGYPYGWTVQRGWRPTERLARYAATKHSRLVAREHAREARWQS